ncbi:MAG TPA: arginine N-succinyltransferase [Bdellovibrionota bacterium]|nr:arginine N-succinyltransferase [Bdellovibrionota bacterium]
MILLREIQEKDLDAIEKLAQVPGMFNLVSDRDGLKDKIRWSLASFRDEIKNRSECKYVFVAEDLEKRQVLGTSMIAAQHGTVEAPHFYFEIGSEEKFSETINTGFIHGTLKLKYDTNGPSEIGALVMDPAHRGSEQRVGRQISFVRFLFLGMNKARFKKKILAELLPPLNKKGQSPLWEAVGRRFTNMDYWEADQLCNKNKEFIFSLFPTGKIYTTFLPAEARNAIGKVGKETEPVLHMLQKIGFKYKNQVDPFDGGPHLWAGVDELGPVKKLSTFTLASGLEAAGSPPDSGLVCRAEQKSGEFRAVAAQVVIKDGRLALHGSQAKTAAGTLGLQAGESVVFMPYY